MADQWLSKVWLTGFFFDIFLDYFSGLWYNITKFLFWDNGFQEKEAKRQEPGTGQPSEENVKKWARQKNLKVVAEARSKEK